jgi:hypothetical protein
MTEEQAKAVQEVAKTSGQLVDTAQRAGSFISKIVGGASSQIGGMLEDNAKLYRYKNLLKIADEVEAIHTQRRVEGKTIPISLRLAIPMLDSAALEDDETLQKVWARLIANSTDPDFKEALHPGYIEIIRQMSPDEAIILGSFLKMKNYPNIFLYHVSRKYSQTNVWNSQNSFKEDKASYEGIYELYLNHCKNLSLIKPQAVRIYVDNLQRLRIVELRQDFVGQDKDDTLWLHAAFPTSEPDRKSILVPSRDEYLRMTDFGKSFIAACIADTAKTETTI